MYCLVGKAGRGGRRLSGLGGYVSIGEDGFIFGEKTSFTKVFKLPGPRSRQ